MKNNETFVKTITLDFGDVDVYEYDGMYDIYDKHGCLNEGAPFYEMPTEASLNDFFKEDSAPVYM